MEKPKLAESLEKLIRFERRILHRSVEEITEEMQQLLRYIQQNYGHEQQTRLGQRFVGECMNLVDLLVAKYVEDVVDVKGDEPCSD